MNAPTGPPPWRTWATHPQRYKNISGTVRVSTTIVIISWYVIMSRRVLVSWHLITLWDAVVSWNDATESCDIIVLWRVMMSWYILENVVMNQESVIRSAHHMEEKDVFLRAEYGQTDSFKIIKIRQEPMPFYRDSDKKAAKTSRISKNMFVLDTYFNLALKKIFKTEFCAKFKTFFGVK